MSSAQNSFVIFLECQIYTLPSGVLLAILESLGYILPMYGEDGTTIILPPGAISAGYQNFFICIEMFFAAIALRYAFPVKVYINESCINADGAGRSVTMQSISSSLKVRSVDNADSIDLPVTANCVLRKR